APPPARRDSASPPHHPTPHRAARRRRRSAPSALPARRAPTPPLRSRRAVPRAGPHPDQSSCALPLALEAGIRHEQILPADFLVVERHRHLEVATRAAQPLNGPAPEAPMPDALSLDEARRVLRRLLG